MLYIWAANKLNLEDANLELPASERDERAREISDPLGCGAQSSLLLRLLRRRRRLKLCVCVTRQHSHSRIERAFEKNVCVRKQLINLNFSPLLYSSCSLARLALACNL